MNERNPAEAVIPLEELRRAAFPKLVVSGGHNVAFDKICDALQAEIEAQRVVIRGSQHSAQRTGGPFNVRLEQFLNDAERTERGARPQPAARRRSEVDASGRRAHVGEPVTLVEVVVGDLAEAHLEVLAGGLGGDAAVARGGSRRRPRRVVACRA